MNNVEKNLDFLLGQTCRMHYNLAGRELESVGLHRGQPRLLLVLTREDGSTHSQLAKHLEVTPATITNMVKRMEQGGFVARQRDTEDERVSRVYLTKAGQAILNAVQERMNQINDMTFAGFSEEEQAQMREYLLRVQTNLQEA